MEIMAIWSSVVKVATVELHQHCYFTVFVMAVLALVLLQWSVRFTAVFSAS
jgi:hypothetical protein